MYEFDSTKKWCPNCGEFRPVEEFYISRVNPDGLRNVCVYHRKLYQKQTHEKTRIAFLTALGGCKCARCGFADWRALQVDHVNGGGRAESKIMGSSTAKYRAHVLANKQHYQVLCANCNWIKKCEREEESSGPKGLSRVIPTERKRSLVSVTNKPNCYGQSGS
jgi:hypothetical protein